MGAGGGRGVGSASGHVNIISGGGEGRVGGGGGGGWVRHVKANFVLPMIICRTPLRQKKYIYFIVVQTKYETKRKSYYSKSKTIADVLVIAFLKYLCF